MGVCRIHWGTRSEAQQLAVRVVSRRQREHGFVAQRASLAWRLSIQLGDSAITTSYWQPPRRHRIVERSTSRDGRARVRLVTACIVHRASGRVVNDAPAATARRVSQGAGGIGATA